MHVIVPEAIIHLSHTTPFSSFAQISHGAFFFDKFNGVFQAVMQLVVTTA